MITNFVLWIDDLAIWFFIGLMLLVIAFSFAKVHVPSCTTSWFKKRSVFNNNLWPLEIMVLVIRSFVALGLKRMDLIK